MSRLHFRIHAAQQDLKERLKAGKFDLDDNDEVGGTQIIPSGNFSLLHGRTRLNLVGGTFHFFILNTYFNFEDILINTSAFNAIKRDALPNGSMGQSCWT